MYGGSVSEDPPSQAEPTPDGRVAALEAEVSRVKAERDKALLARDALIQQVLPSSGVSPLKPQRASSRLLFIIGALLITAGLLAWQLARTKRAISRHSGRGEVAAEKLNSRPVQAVGSDCWPRWDTIVPTKGVGRPTRLELSADAKRVLVGGSNGSWSIFDFCSKRFTAPTMAHRGAVRGVALLSRPERVVTAGADGALRVWTPSGTRVAELRATGPPVRDIAVSRQRHVAVAAEQAVVELYRDGVAPALLLAAHTDWVRAVSFSPDGKLLASAGHDGQIHLWEPKDGTLVKTLPGHQQWVAALAFSHDGQLLASSAFDKSIKLWQLPSGNLVDTLQGGHVQPVVSVRFGPSGLLVSTGLDRRVVLWDLATATPQATLTGHRYQVNAAVIGPKDSFLVSSSGDATLRFWPRPRVVTRNEPPRPGELMLRNNTTGEFLRIAVVDERGKATMAGLRQMGTFLRSRPDDREKPPDRALVELLYRVAEHFGRQREIQLISGFRSPQYNALRLKQSTQVAKKSQHMEGKAIDFRIEGVAITSLHRYVRSLRAGGVGFYADSQFIHMDTGPVRYWEGN